MPPNAHYSYGAWDNFPYQENLSQEKLHKSDPSHFLIEYWGDVLRPKGWMKVIVWRYCIDLTYLGCCKLTFADTGLFFVGAGFVGIFPPDPTPD